MGNAIPIEQKGFAPMIQVSAWILSILSPFLIPPPIDNIPDFAKFLVAAIIGLTVIPFAYYSSIKYAWKWWTFATIFLSLGLVLFLYYSQMLPDRTVIHGINAGQSGCFVIGNDKSLTPIGRKAKQEEEERLGRRITNEELVGLFSIKNPSSFEEIWTKESIASNRWLLISFYTFSLLSLSLFISTLVQAINVFNKRSTA